MNKTIGTILILIILGLGAWLMFGRSVDIEDPNTNGGQLATTTPETGDIEAVLRLNQPEVIKGHTVTVWAVTEDSRCASDVQCIQAGRVTVALKIQSGMGDAFMEMEPGETITTESMALTLDKVEPYPVSTHKISDAEYRFHFTAADHNSGI